MESIYGIVKPVNWTSHDVVQKIRNITGIKKVGHAGTLDPLASGVLVVAIGRQATKQLLLYVKKEKEYSAHIRLDAKSTTGDSEGEMMSVVGTIPTKGQIFLVLSECIGTLSLMPPQYSAIKVNGVPAYRRARKKQYVDLKPRSSIIHDIFLISYSWPMLHIRVTTGPGVYVRSLAEHIGSQLGVGGFLHKLERIRVGQFTLSNSLRLDEFKNNGAFQLPDVDEK